MAISIMITVVNIVKVNMATTVIIDQTHMAITIPVKPWLLGCYHRVLTLHGDVLRWGYPQIIKH